MEKTSRWWQDTKESVKTAVEKTQNFVEKIGNSIKEGLNECATKAKEGLNCLVEGAKGVWNAVTNFVEEHPLIATGILIAGLAALTFFTGGAASAIFLAATKGAILGAISGLEFGVVTAGVNKLIYGDSYSLDDAKHDIGKSIFSGALTGAITGGAVEAGKQLWSKVGGKVTSALGRSANKGRRKTDFYVTPSGEAVPATGYRYMPRNAEYMSELKETMMIPSNTNGTYISFDRFDTPNPQKLQVPHDASIRGKFDTLQIIDDIRIPNGKWGTASWKEPITKDFPNFGQGGATQAITNHSIILDELEDLLH